MNRLRGRLVTNDVIEVQHVVSPPVTHHNARISRVPRVRTLSIQEKIENGPLDALDLDPDPRCVRSVRRSRGRLVTNRALVEDAAYRLQSPVAHNPSHRASAPVSDL